MAIRADKQAAAVDVLTNGRLRLGVGIGWNDVEYEALGEDFKNRGSRSAEQIELLKKLDLSDKEIKNLKKESDRAEKINELYKDNKKLIDDIDTCLEQNLVGGSITINSFNNKQHHFN